MMRALNYFNSSTNNKNLYRSNLKALADDKINEAQNLKFVFRTVKNVVGKGGNAGY